MDNYPISGKSLEKFYHVNGDLLVQQYKKHLSDYSSWKPRSHADKWLLFPGNLGPRLSIDESSLSRGELYTIVTNKDGHGGKGTLVAIIEGVKAVEVSSILRKLPVKPATGCWRLLLTCPAPCTLSPGNAFPTRTGYRSLSRAEACL